MVEGNGDGDDDGAILRELEHILEVDGIERGFAGSDDEFKFFFKSNIGGAFEEVGRDTMVNASECSHTTGDDDDGMEAE